MISLLILEVIIFVLVTSLEASRPTYTKFELTRRSKLGDLGAKLALSRQKYCKEIESIRLMIQIACSIFIYLTLAQTFVIPWSLLASLLLLWIGLRLAGYHYAVRLSAIIYSKVEKPLLKWLAEHHQLLKWLFPSSSKRGQLNVGSIEDAVDTLNHSSSTIGERNVRLMKNAIEFENKKVKDLFVAIGDLPSIDSAELMGPLVLDELHQTGFRTFTVVDKKSGMTLGFLDIDDLVSLEIKKTESARRLMHPIKAMVSLELGASEALETMVTQECRYVVVEGEDGAVAGLLYLKDLINDMRGVASK